MTKQILLSLIFFQFVFICCDGIPNSLEVAVQLTIDSNNGGNSSSSKTIRCGFNQSVADIEVLHISLQVTESCDDVKPYTPVASIDLWTKQPVIESVTFADEVSGRIIPKDFLMTYLSVSQHNGMNSRYNERFRCVIQGFYLKGQPVTAIKSADDGMCISSDLNLSSDNDNLIQQMSLDVVNISRRLENISEQLDCNNIGFSFQELSNNLKELNQTLELKAQNVNHDLVELNGNVSNKLDKIHKLVDAGDMRINDTLSDLSDAVKGLDNKLGILDSVVKENDDKMVALNTTIKSLELQIQTIDNKLDVLQNIEDLLTKISKPFWPVDFKDSRFLYPSASHIDRGKLYLFSANQHARFNIDDANDVCKEYGGYLLELDDDEEFLFVLNIVNSISTFQQFYTGYNDRETEGKFIHVNSGRGLKVDKWMAGKPDSFGGDEDCVEIWPPSGLNDEDCDSRGSYICEIPYPF